MRVMRQSLPNCTFCQIPNCIRIYSGQDRNKKRIRLANLCGPIKLQMSRSVKTEWICTMCTHTCTQSRILEDSVSIQELAKNRQTDRQIGSYKQKCALVMKSCHRNVFIL